MSRNNKWKSVKRVFGALVLVVLLGVSALFTYGPRYSEDIPSWQDIYQLVGLTEDEDLAEVYDQPFTMSFLDVGQGSATLLHCKEADLTILVDTGEQGNDETITTELRRVGAKRIDYCVLTHPHSDHVGSFPELVKTVPVKTVVVPELDTSRLGEDKGLYDLTEGSIRVAGAERLVAQPGMALELTAEESKVPVTMEFFGPVGGAAAMPDNLNNSSVLVKVSFGDVSVLLTGDAEREEEENVLDWLNSGGGQTAAVSLQSTVMAAGHHGSYTSNNRRFVAVVKPKYVVISCGKDNDYGHPHDSTLRTFRDIGARIYRTDEQGTIVLGTDGKKVVR